MKSDELSIENFLTDMYESVNTLINENLQAHTNIKANIELFGGYMLEKPDNLEYDIKSFNTQNEAICLSTELKDVYNIWSSKIQAKSEDFNECGSGWKLIEILHLELNVNKHDPLQASASSYIKLPKILESKKGVVNIKNYDNECFGHAIISALRPVKRNSDRISSYPYFRSVLNFDNIEFPMKFSDIHKFEKQNNISVNVFGLNQKKDKLLGPLHHTKKGKKGYSH